MYQVIVKAAGKKASFAPAVFEFDDPASDSARVQLNALADQLYDLDLDFDVDMDGDMMIDDILIRVSDAEEFEEELSDGKKRFLVTGKNI